MSLIYTICYFGLLTLSVKMQKICKYTSCFMNNNITGIMKIILQTISKFGFYLWNLHITHLTYPGVFHWENFLLSSSKSDITWANTVQSMPKSITLMKPQMFKKHFRLWNLIVTNKNIKQASPLKFKLNVFRIYGHTISRWKLS